MAGNSGFGSSLWKDLQKVRVTRGKIEAPVKANGTDGIQIGSPSRPPRTAQPAAEPAPRGRLARLLGRR